MLRHLQRFLWQLEDLALFVTYQRLVAQRAALAKAARTTVQWMKHDMIGLLDGLESPSRVAGLAAARATRLVPQRFGGGLGQAVRRRGLAAVAAAQRQPVFEFFDLATQLTHLLFQAQQQIDQRTEAGASQLPELLAPAHEHKAARKSDLSG